MTRLILTTMENSVGDRLDARNWPFSQDCLPQPVYLVGGAVRDAILGRTREYLDLDFIVPGDAIQVASAIAQRYQAGFVLLDAERKISRVVFPQATVDFAQQEGDSLFTDLHRRDFTINAIAYNPHTKEIIDPLQGYRDLESGLLRMISPANLQDDPLRLMRAYRQAAQLDFTIEPNTQNAIRTLSPYINNVAKERIRVEIGYLLGNAQGTPWLTSAGRDGILANFFTNATEESWRKLAAVDKAAILIEQNWQPLGTKLQEYIRETVKTTWLGIVKLACLVHPNAELAAIELQQLTYSRVEIRAIVTILNLFGRLKTSHISIREQYFFFQAAGEVFAAIVVMALANDIFITELNQLYIDTYALLINRFLNPDDLVAHPSPLVSGRDVIEVLEISASPLIGELLTEIAIAQAEGKVVTVEEAIDFARRFISNRV